MKAGDLVRFTDENRIRLITNAADGIEKLARELYPFKFEAGLVMGTAPLSCRRQPAVEVVFPSKTGNFEHSALEVVSESR